jgi:hypothetical protein
MSQRVYTYYSKSRGKRVDSYKKKKRKKSANGVKRKNKNSGWSVIKASFSFVFALGLLILLMILYNLQYAVIEKDLVEIRELKKDLKYMQNQQKQLIVDIKRLKHVNRINKLGASQLGLVPYSEKPKILVVDQKELKEAQKKDRMLYEQGG